MYIAKSSKKSDDAPTAPGWNVQKADAQSQVKYVNDDIASYLRGNLHEPGLHQAGSMTVAKGVAAAATKMLARTPDAAIAIRDLVRRTLDAIATSKSAPISFERPDPYNGVDVASYFREVPSPMGGTHWEFDLAGFFAAIHARRGY